MAHTATGSTGEGGQAVVGEAVVGEAVVGTGEACIATIGPCAPSERSRGSRARPPGRSAHSLVLKLSATARPRRQPFLAMICAPHGDGVK